jgi:hypothetical protein
MRHALHTALQLEPTVDGSGCYWLIVPMLSFLQLAFLSAGVAVPVAASCFKRFCQHQVVAGGGRTAASVVSSALPAVQPGVEMITACRALHGAATTGEGWSGLYSSVQLAVTAVCSLLAAKYTCNATTLAGHGR